MNEGIKIFICLVVIILACIYIARFIDSIKNLKEEAAITNRYLKYFAFLISQQTTPDLSVEEPYFLNPKPSDAKNQKE